MSDRNELSEGTLDDLVRDVLRDDDLAPDYLLQAWLDSSIQALQEARRRADLTQADVAQTLGTRQPNIARLENDSTGGVSLRRYASYAIACGVLPLDVRLEPLANVRMYALHDPNAARSETLFNAWRAAEANRIAIPGNSVPSMTSQGVGASIEETLKDVLKQLDAAYKAPIPQANRLTVPDNETHINTPIGGNVVRFQQPWNQDLSDQTSPRDARERMSA